MLHCLEYVTDPKGLITLGLSGLSIKDVTIPKPHKSVTFVTFWILDLNGNGTQLFKSVPFLEHPITICLSGVLYQMVHKDMVFGTRPFCVPFVPFWP